MARIEWVKQRLDNWARWASQRESGALGYPKQAAFARLAPGGTSMGAAVPVDSLDASITDDAVQSFRWTHPHIHLTLRCHYIDGFEIRRVALKMSRAESTIKAHLDQADHLIAAWFRARDEVRAKIKGGFTT